MHKKIHEHFKKNDPILYAELVRIGQIPLPTRRKPSEYFHHLCSEIIGQQLSGKAANAIFKRFVTLFPKQKITPERILSLKDEDIRNIGTSWAKVRYLKDLSQKIRDRALTLRLLEKLSDEETVKELTKVKGIGPWTAEMFLMFTLGREDLFSHGDLGLRKALKKLYGFKKDSSQKQVEKIVQKWSPYKTYACLILWQSLEK